MINDKKKMKIVYCIPSLHSSWGMERVLTLKANYLASRGHEIHIVVTDGSDKTPYFPLEKSIKIHQLSIEFEELYIHSFLYRAWLYQLRMRKFKEKLNFCLSEIKPDITVSLLRRDINIINLMTDGSLKVGEMHFNKLFYRDFNVSWLPLSIHNYLRKLWMNQLIRKLQKLAAFAVLTYEDASSWEELKNVIVIPNPTSFYPDVLSDSTNKQVITAGRYVSQKGFDRLIIAWKKVVDVHPDWILKIYGDGWQRKQLQRQIEDLGLSGSCFLEHTTSDLGAKFQESSIFVLSSRFEGFGLVIIESMAYGLPVVAFDCHCGPSEIISDGVDGLLVAEGDIEKLAEKIIWLIEHEELRKEMGKHARQKVEKYKIEYIGAKWESLFESLLKQNRR